MIFVKIDGSNFGINKDNLKVYFGPNLARIVSLSAEQITVEIPSYKVAESTPIVIERNGVKTSSEVPFQLNGPKISSFTPLEGAGLLEFTIMGENFSPVAHRNTVHLSNPLLAAYPATVLSATANELKVQIDARRIFPGDYTVTVTNDDKAAVGKEIFRLKTPWTKLANRPPGGLSVFATFEIDNKIYVCGGNIVTGKTNQLWQFDIASYSWTRKGDFPGGVRVSAIGFAIDGKGYVGTGYGSSNATNDFWEYSPATDSWTQKANFPGGLRAGAIGVSYGGKGYVGFGHARLMDLWEYDPLANSWSQQPSFPGTYRARTQTIVLKDKLYVMGGLSNSGHIKESWCYDFSNRSWRMVGEIPFTLIASFYSSERCYLVFPDSYFGFVQLRLLQFDPETNTVVKELPVFPGNERYDGLYKLSNNVLLFGLGDFGSNLYNDIWEFPID